MVYNNILDLIGNTPILKMNNLDVGDNEIFVKLEYYNVGGSIKSRTVLGIIEDAEQKGLLKQGSIIIEATSGNTGISLSMIAQAKGYQAIIVMPESVSVERRVHIESYGATVILTDSKFGMQGAMKKANELISTLKAITLNQFENQANADYHYKTTAEEIINDMPDLDILVAGVGTAGTIMGIAKRLKEINKNVKIIAVEPEKSPVLSGGIASSHKIQGIGAGFVPKIYDATLVDKIVKVSDENAITTCKNIINNEQIMVGISSGAAIYAAIQESKISQNLKILAIAPDGAKKYFSMNLL